MEKPGDHHPLHVGIHQVLADIAATRREPPPWHQAWLGLQAGCTDEERLAVYRAVRDAGSVPADAGLFLVAWILDLLVDERSEQELHDHEEHLKEIRQHHGLDEDTPATENTPSEYREAMREMQDAWNRLYVTTLEASGERELARLFRHNEDEFYDRYEAGRQFFFPANEDPADEGRWLLVFIEEVNGCVEADSPMGPLGLRSRREGDFWEMTVHPTPVELIGGRHDGEHVVPGFRLDLGRFQALFESVEDFGWNAIGLNEPQGPYVWLEGVYQERHVFVEVLAYPPDDEEPGLKVEATRKPRQPEE